MIWFITPIRGYGTAELSIALKLFRLIGDQNSKDVEVGRIEPPSESGFESASTTHSLS